MDKLIDLPENPQQILFIRTDSIGDNILAASMLEPLRNKYPNAKITLVCQEHISEIYEVSPFVNNIITYRRKLILEDTLYRNSIIKKLQGLKADIAFNTIYSRQILADLLTINSNARVTIAFNGDLCNINENDRDELNKKYSHILYDDFNDKPEIEKYEFFLTAIGISFEKLEPVIWLTPEDEKFANVFFAENDLNPAATIALFAGSDKEIRSYEKFGFAIADICRENILAVIATGTEKQYQVSQKNLEDIRTKTINLCGKTSIRQTAAIIKQCRLAVGSETGTAQISCAVGTPNVVVLGGGHFGRFLPYSPLTSIACLPLQCYGCNFYCKYPVVHCVSDVNPFVITEAVKEALKQRSEKIRIYIQDKSLWFPTANEPESGSLEPYINTDGVEIFKIDSTYSNWDKIVPENVIESFNEIKQVKDSGASWLIIRITQIFLIYRLK
jgi:ADP-heptose:LPS heptosyltransferase